MSLNGASVWKVMTIRISRGNPLFNFERLDILCAWIGQSCEMLWPFEFLESFHRSISSVSIYYMPELDIREKSYDQLNFSRAPVVQFRASRYIMHLNRTSELKVIIISISREFSLFNFERLDILCAWIGHPSEKLWPFEFLGSFRRSISSIAIYYVPKSDICVKSYDHLNFSRVSIFQFWASRYLVSQNQTSVWKVTITWISWKIPLFNFERLDILGGWIGHLS